MNSTAKKFIIFIVSFLVLSVFLFIFLRVYIYPIMKSSSKSRETISQSSLQQNEQLKLQSDVSLESKKQEQNDIMVMDNEMSLLLDESVRSANNQADRAISMKSTASHFSGLKDDAKLVFPFSSEISWEEAIPLDSEGNVFVASIEREQYTEGLGERGIYLYNKKDNSNKPILMFDEDFRGRISGISPDKKQLGVVYRNKSGGESMLMTISIDNPNQVIKVENSEGAGGKCTWDQQGKLYFAKQTESKRVEINIFDGAKTVPLAIELEGDHYDPFVTKDGSSLYFVSKSPRVGGAEKRNTTMIQRYNFETKSLDNICEGKDPVLLPDESGIVYVKKEKNGFNQIYLLDFDSMQPKALTRASGSHVKVSEDGKKAFFLSHREYGNSNLFEINIE